MKGLAAWFGLLLLGPATAAERPNILLIAIDDLNDYVGCLGGHPDAKTPNIDALAQEGVLFTNAHCNSPVCNPSRASIWTGLRPTTTGITTNPSGWFRDNPKFRNVTTIPQALAKAGYSTRGFGKLFHLGHGNQPWPDWQQHRKYGYGPRLVEHLNYRDGDGLSDWGVPPRGKGLRQGSQPSDPAMASFDEDIAQQVIEILNDEHERPFFLGCGFYRPHTPLDAREEWFEKFPIDEIHLPTVQLSDVEDLPYFGKKERREQDIEAPGLWNHEWVVRNGTWKEILQPYLASIAAVDHEVGRVIEALRMSKHSENTVVVLFSDHGWHLGEKQHWGKAALWEQTTRVPLIFRGREIAQGRVRSEPVELLSLYPTLLDIANGQASHALERISLRPLLSDTPATDWPQAAVTTFSDHHALKTVRWRYILYEDGGEELYDHESDPNEWHNLADEGHEMIFPLREQLEKILT